MTSLMNDQIICYNLEQGWKTLFVSRAILELSLSKAKSLVPDGAEMGIL